MRQRVDLQMVLENTLGSRNVYYQPPESLKLQYPCIVYELNNIKTFSADNENYRRERSYSITLIHKNPDNDIVDKILDLQYANFDRQFKVDGLYHYVFELYF